MLSQNNNLVRIMKKDYKYAITNGQRFIEITPNTPLSNVAYFCDVHLSNSYNGNGAYSL